MSAIGFESMVYKGVDGREVRYGLAVIDAGDGRVSVMLSQGQAGQAGQTPLIDVIDGIATQVWKSRLWAICGSEGLASVRFFIVDDGGIEEVCFGLAPAGMGGFYALPRVEKVF